MEGKDKKRRRRDGVAFFLYIQGERFAAQRKLRKLENAIADWG